MKVRRRGRSAYRPQPHAGISKLRHLYSRAARGDAAILCQGHPGKRRGGYLCISGFAPARSHRRKHSASQAGPLKTHLASRLRHRHDFQQVTIRIFEIETAPAAARVNLAIGVIEGPTAVGQLSGLDLLENRIEFDIADMEGVVMAVARAGVEAPWFRVVGEGQGEMLVNLHFGEVTPTDLQAENFGEELCGRHLVLRRHNRVIQVNRHVPTSASDSSVPGIADFWRVRPPAFTDILQSVGDRDSGKILDTLVPELARDA